MAVWLPVGAIVIELRKAVVLNVLGIAVFSGIFLTVMSAHGYTDSIGINLSGEINALSGYEPHGSPAIPWDGKVDASYSDGYVAQANWNNWDWSDGGDRWNSLTPKSADGTPVPALTFDIYFDASQWVEPEPDPWTVYSSTNPPPTNLVQICAHGFNNPHISIGNVPFGTYDIYALSGNGTWYLWAADVTTNNYAAWGANSWQVAAVQILSKDTVPEIDILGTNSATIANGDITPDIADGTYFGSVITNTADVTRVFTITNSGGLPIYLTNPEIVLLTGDTTCFTLHTNGMVTNLPAASATTFSITYSPTTLGTWTGLVTIANTDNNENPYRFLVQGSGVARTPEIDLLGMNSASISNGDSTPNPDDGTDFETVLVASGHRDHEFTVTNSGSATLYLNGSPTVAIGGPNASDFSIELQPSPTNLAVGAMRTFTVRFDPSATGLRQASVIIANSDTNEGSYVFSVCGTGTDVEDPRIAVKGIDHSTITNGDNSASLLDGTDFGSVRTNAPPHSHVFSITNTGTGPLYLSGLPAIAVEGTHSADFAVSVQPFPTNVAADGGTVFTVQFDPSDTGVRQAVISIVNNDSGENPYIFCIQGTGEATPANKEFSGVGVNFMESGGSTTGLVSGIAGPMPQRNWNNVIGNVNQEWGGAQFGSEATDLTNDTGLATTCDVSAYQPAGDQNGFYLANSFGVSEGGSQNEQLYVKSLGCAESVQITLSSIPYGQYDLYVGFQSGSGYRIGGVTRQISSFVAPSGGFAEATAGNGWVGNYVKWANLTNASVTVDPVEVWDNSTIAWAQIVAEGPRVENTGATLLGGVHATLSGRLVSSGSAPADLWVYWGPTDEGTDSALWTNSYNFGYVTNGAYSVMVGPLALRTKYYYRFFAGNTYGSRWADSTAEFTSEGGTAVIIR